MGFLENDLEEIIFNTNHVELFKRGLDITGNLKRQLRIGNYGVADLIEFRRPIYCGCEDGFLLGKIRVLELKKDLVNIDTFFQAVRYARGVQSYLKYTNPYLLNNVELEVALIGKKVDKRSSLTYLPSLFNDSNNGLGMKVSIFEYTYEVDGIRFKKIKNYTLTNEGFGHEN